MTDVRRCESCRKPIPIDARRDARTCSGRCRMALYRASKVSQASPQALPGGLRRVTDPGEPTDPYPGQVDWDDRYWRPL